MGRVSEPKGERERERVLQTILSLVQGCLAVPQSALLDFIPSREREDKRHCKLIRESEKKWCSLYKK